MVESSHCSVDSQSIGLVPAVYRLVNTKRDELEVDVYAKRSRSLLGGGYCLLSRVHRPKGGRTDMKLGDLFISYLDDPLPANIQGSAQKDET